jgi:hypothetical protein
MGFDPRPPACKLDRHERCTDQGFCEVGGERKPLSYPLINRPFSGRPQEVPSVPDPTDQPAPFDHEQRALAAAYRSDQRRRIVDAAGIDPSKLSVQAQRILNWLSDWDDWTTGGIVELLQAARTAAQVTEHRDLIQQKVDALREAEARTTAAITRYDHRWGVDL